MSEDRAGSARPSARGTRPSARFTIRLGAPPGRHRRLRRLTVTGVPAVMALAGAFPFLISTAPAGPASSPPSRILCASWGRCDARGYDSYGYRSHESRAYWRMTPYDQCTNYAAFVEATVFHAPTPSYLLGNGGQWAASAASHGVVVNHTPSVGAVAQWDGGTLGIGPIGHVAVVEQVGPQDKYIVISQQHMGGVAGYNWTLIKAHYPASEWQEWPNSFIHFRIPQRANVGYFNPRTDTFGLRDSQTAGPADRSGHLGLKGAVPLIGDWRGGGTDGMGFYNPRYGTFHLLGAGARHSNIEATFGPPHMIPLVGDWKRTGRDGIGFYDRQAGVFYLRQSLKAGPADDKFAFGRPGMVPLAGDWNGDGEDGVGYYNPNTGIFNLRNTLTHGPAWVSFRFGPPHMIPIAGNWTGSGHKDGVGYYNPRTGTFYLRDRLTKGPAAVVVRFGPPRMVPLTGEWFGA